jgi:hypothetical protein
VFAREAAGTARVVLAHAAFAGFLTRARWRTKIEAFSGVVRELAGTAVVAPAILADLTLVATFVATGNVFALACPVRAIGVSLPADVNAFSCFNICVLTRRIANVRATQHALAVDIVARGAAAVADEGCSHATREDGRRVDGPAADRRAKGSAGNGVPRRAVQFVAHLIALGTRLGPLS